MSILKQLNTLLETILPIETGVFSKSAPVEYIVLTPLSDRFETYTDNKPSVDVQEVRISLYSKKNYIKLKNQLVKLLIQADFVITDRRYIEDENDTGYHHYVIDVANYYEMEEL